MSSDYGVKYWAGVMTENGSTLFKQPKVNKLSPPTQKHNYCRKYWFAVQKLIVHNDM